MTKRTKKIACLSGTAFVLAALFSSCEKTPVYPDAQFDFKVNEQRQTHTFIWDYMGAGAGASASGLSCKEQVDGDPLVVTSWNRVTIKATSTDPHFQGVSVSSSDGKKVWVREISTGDKHDEYELVYSSDTERNDTQVNFDTPEFFWKQKTWTKSDYGPGLVTVTVSAGSFTKSFKVAARDVIPLQAIRLKFGDPQSNYYVTEANFDPSSGRHDTNYKRDQYVDITINPKEIRDIKDYKEAYSRWEETLRDGYMGNMSEKYQLKEDPLFRSNDWYELIEIDNLVPENASWRTADEFLTYGRNEEPWLSFDAFNERFNLGLPVFCENGRERNVDFSELKGRKAAYNFGRCGGDMMNKAVDFHMRTQWRGYDGGRYEENVSNRLYLEISAFSISWEITNKYRP